MLMSKGKETNLSQVACSSFITSLIHFFDMKNYTNVDCAFHYWAEQNCKVLSQLAWIAFAVTMTQVSVERLQWRKLYIKWFVQFFGRRHFASNYVATHLCVSISIQCSYSAFTS